MAGSRPPVRQNEDWSFSIRARDRFVEAFGPELIVRMRTQPPSVRLRFEPNLPRHNCHLTAAMNVDRL